jgi:hypothetical protein
MAGNTIDDIASIYDTVKGLYDSATAPIGGAPAGTKSRTEWNIEWSSNPNGHPTLDSYIAANGAPYVPAG